MMQAKRIPILVLITLMLSGVTLTANATTSHQINASFGGSCIDQRLRDPCGLLGGNNVKGLFGGTFLSNAADNFTVESTSLGGPDDKLVAVAERSYLSFQIPDFGGQIISAKFNNLSHTNDGNSVFFSTSLNTDGIAALNAAQGSEFLLGGVNDSNNLDSNFNFSGSFAFLKLFEVSDPLDPRDQASFDFDPFTPAKAGFFSIKSGPILGDFSSFESTRPIEAGPGSTSYLEVTVVPVPPAIWLLGSGFIGLVSMARRKKKAV